MNTQQRFFQFVQRQNSTQTDPNRKVYGENEVTGFVLGYFEQSVLDAQGNIVTTTTPEGEILPVMEPATRMHTYTEANPDGTTKVDAQGAPIKGQVEFTTFVVSASMDGTIRANVEVPNDTHAAWLRSAIKAGTQVWIYARGGAKWDFNKGEQGQTYVSANMRPGVYTILPQGLSATPRELPNLGSAATPMWQRQERIDKVIVPADACDKDGKPITRVAKMRVTDLVLEMRAAVSQKGEGYTFGVVVPKTGPALETQGTKFFLNFPKDTTKPSVGQQFVVTEGELRVSQTGMRSVFVADFKL